MLASPNEPLPGQIVRAADSAAIARYVRSTTSRSAPGQLTVVGSGGSTRRPVPRFPVKRWPLSNQALHIFSIIDVSVGPTPMIRVTPGYITDYSNAALPWMPTINGNPINVPIGSPLAPPALTLASTDTSVFFDSSINSTTGAITGVAVAHAAMFPSGGSTASDWYLLISDIAITFDVSGNAHVRSLDDGVKGAVNYQFCGALPLVNGNNYQSGPAA